jgi:ABC-type glycerol-3-phosphate transport system substrate-binding protein
MKGPRLIVGVIFVTLFAWTWITGLQTSRNAADNDPAVPTLRIAHTLLHAGLRETIDTLARDYEALQAAKGHPVRIRQIPIPERTYTQWLRTQIVGGTAPEIVAYTTDFDDSMIARSFLPLGGEIDQPNPYNEATALAEVPWRDTFFDGLQFGGYHFRLAEHYGVPLSAMTVRLFVNRSLWAEILAHPLAKERNINVGPDGLATTYEDFIAICELARDWAALTRRPVVPIAGSDQNSRFLYERLVGSLTQRLAWDWSPIPEARFDFGWVLLEYSLGQRRFDQPIFRATSAITQEVATFLQPGFLQMRREDAAFYFSQQHALMIVASSWDWPNFQAMIDGRFEVGVSRVPVPDRTHPRYGEFVVDRTSETDTRPALVFSVLSHASQAQRALALDFLRYLTALSTNQVFSDASGWLPSILGVKPTAELRPFMPDLEGILAGPQPHVNATDLRRIMEQHMHLLLGAGADLDRYMARVDADFPAAALRSLQRLNTSFLRNSNVQDSIMAAHRALSQLDPSRRADTDTRIAGLLDSAASNEAPSLWRETYERMHSPPAR